jgi:predicted nucleotidyltransferase
MQDKKEILKVLVGSQAHGLADADSDYDYRAVYVLPTSQILSLGYKYHGNDWVEGVEDNTAYEIGHFLQLATKCNSTILEVFRAPIISVTDEGYYLRQLFPYVWNPKGVFDAFVGYGLNQRKKFLDRKDNRQNKYAVAYIRTLYNLIELLSTKNFHVKIADGDLKDILMKYKQGYYAMGEVIDLSELLVEQAKQALKMCKHEPDINKVNECLLKIRQENW